MNDQGLNITDYWLKTEKRGNFVTSEVMKRSWAAELAVLRDIKRVCEKHSIKYFAVYGTLLGAVRHGGYIPWDDDIDIGMLRDDYISFMNVIEEEYGDKYNIFNPYTKPWYCMNFSHITNNNDLCFEREYLKKWFGCPFIVGADVFPYYYIPRDPDAEKYIMGLLAKIDSTMALCRQSAAVSQANGSFDASSRLNEITARSLIELQHETGFEFDVQRPLDNQLEILYDQVCRITEPDEADYVARFDEYAKDRTKKFRKEWIENVVELPFENTYMSVPAAYDAVLDARFGRGYMMPRQERGAHDYPFFKKQLEDLGEKLDFGETAKAIEKLDDIPIRDVGEKKIYRILYYASVSSMLIYNECVIEKIRSILEGIKKYDSNIRLCWLAVEFPETEDQAMGLVAPELISEYENLLIEYEEKGMIIRSATAIDDIINSDAYLGDSGKVADAFTHAGRPVVLQDYRNNSLDDIYSVLRRLDIEVKAADLHEKGALNKAIDEHTCKKMPDGDGISNLDDDWKKIICRPDGGRKKTVLFINTISTLFHYKEKMIEKLKSVLQTFYDDRDNVALIWRPQSNIEKDKRLLGDALYKAYAEIVAQYRKDAWGIYDDKGEPYGAIMAADAYYGDADPAAELMRKALKPVMIADPECL